MSIIDRLEKAAEHLGLKCQRVEDVDGFQFDGSTIKYIGSGWNCPITRDRAAASNLAHDIAHWLVAPTERRSVPDFGLGLGPDSYTEDKNFEPLIRGEASRAEEERASMLGMLLEAHAGQDPYEFTFLEHSWHDTFNIDRDHITEVLIGLQSDDLAVDLGTAHEDHLKNWRLSDKVVQIIGDINSCLRMK